MLKRKRRPVRGGNHSINRERYLRALAEKDVPPLVLDNKWHMLFTHAMPTPRIKVLSQEMNKLLKRQGQLFNDIKDIRAVKQRLMDTIMDDMGLAADSDELDRKMRERSRLVEECSEKIDLYMAEYKALPDRIKEVNTQLMIETMDVCYSRIRENLQEIEEIDDWVEKTREELKQQLIISEEDEVVNHSLYSFMHDIFGSKVMEIFDVQYDPVLRKVKSKHKSVED